MASKNKTQGPPSQPRTTVEQVQQYEALMPLLRSMFDEFKELSKKKADAVLNKRKVEIVNRLLKDVLTILENEPTKPYLDLLDEDDLPQNSDVLLMLTSVLGISKCCIWHSKALSDRRVRRLSAVLSGFQGRAQLAYCANFTLWSMKLNRSFLIPN